MGYVKKNRRILTIITVILLLTLTLLVSNSDQAEFVSECGISPVGKIKNLAKALGKYISL